VYARTMLADKHLCQIFTSIFLAIGLYVCTEAFEIIECCALALCKWSWFFVLQESKLVRVIIYEPYI